MFHHLYIINEKIPQNLKCICTDFWKGLEVLEYCLAVQYLASPVRIKILLNWLLTKQSKSCQERRNDLNRIQIYSTRSTAA